MTTQEANKMCAEFMGINIIDINGVCHIDGTSKTEPLYKYSLDALVSVWNKMEISGTELMFNKYARGQIEVVVKWGNAGHEWTWNSGKTIQEAAVIATAKAIKEIKK